MLGRLVSISMLLLALASCASEPGPRETVKHFLQSLREDTTSYDYLSQLLDLDELVTENSIYTYDSTISFAANKQGLVSLLQKDGDVRTRWIKDQIILGDVEILGDTATVEVSFVDKTVVPVKQFYNRMGVHVVDGRWKVFSLRLL
jgi:hypothetical protein